MASTTAPNQSVVAPTATTGAGDSRVNSSLYPNISGDAMDAEDEDILASIGVPPAKTRPPRPPPPRSSSVPATVPVSDISPPPKSQVRMVMTITALGVVSCLKNS